MLQVISKPKLDLAAAVSTPEDADALCTLATVEARNGFFAYRQHINPRFVWGWFARELARGLRQFYDDFVAGKRPILVLVTPPQFGKSIAVLDFIAWVVGHNPDLRIIYTSFSDRLSVRANLRMQRALDSERYQRIFPATRLDIKGGHRALRNYDMLEFLGCDGYFRNSTVLGSITGEALDLGIVDDPRPSRSLQIFLGRRLDQFQEKVQSLQADIGLYAVRS